MPGSRFAPPPFLPPGLLAGLSLASLSLGAGCTPPDPDPPGEVRPVARFAFEPIAAQYEPRPATFRAVELKRPHVYALTREGELFVFESGDGPARQFAGGVRAGLLGNGPVLQSPLQLPALAAAFLLPDVREPAGLRLLSRTEVGGDGTDLELVGEALLTPDRGGVRAWDVRDPAAPREAGRTSFGRPFRVSGMARAGETVYLVGDGAIRGYGVADPFAPTRGVDVAPAVEPLHAAAASDGRFLYVVNRERPWAGPARARGENVYGEQSGIAVYDCWNPAELPLWSFTPLCEAPYHVFPAGTPSDRRLVACGDGSSRYQAWGTNVKVNLAATATVYAVAPDGTLTKSYTQPRAGGRAAAWSPHGGGRLVCDGLTYRVGPDAMTLTGAFRPVGGTLDGSHYPGDADGSAVALAADDTVAVVALGVSTWRALGELAGRALPAWEPFPARLLRTAGRFLYAAPPAG